MNIFEKINAEITKINDTNIDIIDSIGPSLATNIFTNYSDLDVSPARLAECAFGEAVSLFDPGNDENSVISFVAWATVINGRSRAALD